MDGYVGSFRGGSRRNCRARGQRPMRVLGCDVGVGVSASSRGLLRGGVDWPPLSRPASAMFRGGSGERRPCARRGAAGMPLARRGLAAGCRQGRRSRSRAPAGSCPGPDRLSGSTRAERLGSCCQPRWCADPEREALARDTRRAALIAWLSYVRFQNLLGIAVLLAFVAVATVLAACASNRTAGRTSNRTPRPRPLRSRLWRPPGLGRRLGPASHG